MKKFCQMTFVGILVSLLLTANVLAHGTGHGPKIDEAGPNGGKLAAVVDAKQADLGEKAKIEGIAELVEEEGLFKIYFYDTDKKPLAADYLQPTAKIIALGSTASKPLIEQAQKKGEAFVWEPKIKKNLRQQLRVIEVILILSKDGAKKVTAFNI